MVNLEGTLLKGYQLEEQIGNGGFGAVYRANQTIIGREVAVKIILPGHANKPEFIRRFESEAYLIGRLEHPHITPLYDFWRDPSGAYLVMRYLRGGSVQDRLRVGPYELNAVSMLLDQISSALDFAHRHDVIHQDVKPGNILLDEDGNAYLVDFGIAKDVTGVIGSSTAVDAVMGSLDYISPEQARSEPVTPRTDIYGLGVTLYELITGEHPFKNASSVERLYKHCNDPLPEINNLPAGAHDAVNEIIQKATIKNPEHRYPDVLALAVAFREGIGRNATQSATSIVEQLTMREQEVLALVANGLSNHEISEKLVVSIGTVKWHINQLYKKLGVRSRVQAIVHARELDLIFPSDTPDSLLDFNGSQTSISLPIPDNPYKGLHAFQVTDARDFFGRDDLAKKLIDRMCEKVPYYRFLAVVGPSGSGKSSIVRAGLIPALWKGAIPGSEKWFIVDMIPGAHPLDKLEAALMRVAADQAKNLREQLQRDERGLLRVADILLPGDSTELVIIVDQFEEVFTLIDAEKERQHFLDLLRCAVSDIRSRVRVVVTLRADYYDRPLHYPEFGELVRDQMETVLPLPVKGLERAIRGPAERVGVTFEQGLVEQIVSTMSYQTGALPLLQYALTELFDRREGHLLTHEAYQQIGGAVGALATRADDIYRSLTDDAQNLAHQMFMRLVTLGEGAEDTRRRATHEELLSLTDNADQMEEIIDQFAAYRLLSLDHDPETRQPTVEVAHEAILREWDRLRQWLNESRTDIRQERALARAAVEWDAHNQDMSFLLRGARLEQAEKWQQETALIVSPLEREFIAACITQRGRENELEAARQAREAKLEKRSRNVLRALVAVFAVAAVVAGLLAFDIQANFLRAERIRLAAQAQIALDKGEDVRLPALLALRSLKLGYSPEADAALLTALTRDFPVQTYEGHTGDGITGVHFAPDGSRILTTGTDGTARLWDTATGAELQRFSGHMHILHSAAFMPNGESILTSGNDGTVRQWDIARGQETARILEQDTSNLKLDLSPDGQLLATSDDNQRIHLWRFDTMELLHTLEGHTDLVNQVAFAPDGRTLVSASFDRTVRLWNVGTGNETQRFEGHAARVFGVAFSPNSSIIASASDDSTVRLWHVETGDEIRRFIGTDSMLAVAFSPDGQTIVTGSLRSNSVTLWDLETGDKLHEIQGGTSGAGFVAFSPDGQFVLSAGTDNMARLWNTTVESEPQIYSLPFSAIHAEAVMMAALVNEDQQLLTVLGEGIVRIWNVATNQIERDFKTDVGGFVTDAALTPQHDKLITVSEDGIARVWNVFNGELTREFEGHDRQINAVSLAPDGDLFVTGGNDGTVRLWTINASMPAQSFVRLSVPINDVALSHDKHFVAAASEDGIARLWDARTGAAIQRFTGHSGAILSIAFSPDSRYVITGGDDNVALLWDVETGELIQSFFGHTDAVSVVGYSSDGQMVITGSRDQSVRLWDVTTGEVIRQFVGHKQPLLSVSMSNDGDSLISGDLGYAYLWRTNLAEITTLACQIIPNDLTLEERRRYSITDNDNVCA